MIRSLSTGISGLKTNQTRMDVVGNNIANINTVAFKRGRTAFSEVLGQQQLGVGRMAGGNGINPSFVGLGASVSSIDQAWTQGSLQNTNVITDLGLSGDGFFVINDGTGNVLSRAGNFTFNDQGQLVTSEGLSVQGYGLDEDGNVDMTTLQDMRIDWSAQATPRATENVQIAGNLSTETPSTEPFSISTNVYDEQGNTHTLVVEFTPSVAEAGDPDYAEGERIPNQWDYTMSYQGDLATPPFTVPADGTVTFNTDGSIATPDPATLDIPWDAAYVDGGTPFTLDLGGITQVSGSSTATVRDQDGYGSGQLVSYGIDPQGFLMLNFSNGEQESVGQLAIGTVNNPNGLEQRGQNYYGLSAASGDLILGRAGSELSTSVVSGALEQSNVDLATEFTDMIVAQRGYQAAARVITTSDELLQETVSLKR